MLEVQLVCHRFPSVHPAQMAKGGLEGGIRLQ